MRRAQPLGPAEHALMGLIHLRPRHGYDLAACFGPGGDLSEVCALQPSLLYSHLKRLERLGYVATTTEVVGARPPRHVYRLTEAGVAEFSRWLDQPSRRNREIRMEFLLRLYFSERIPRHDTLRLVDAQLAVAREELLAVQRDLERYPPRSFPRLLRQMRLVATRGTIQWLAEYREELVGAAPRDAGPASDASLKSASRG